MSQDKGIEGQTDVDFGGMQIGVPQISTNWFLLHFDTNSYPETFHFDEDLEEHFRQVRMDCLWVWCLDGEGLRNHGDMTNKTSFHGSDRLRHVEKTACPIYSVISQGMSRIDLKRTKYSAWRFAKCWLYPEGTWYCSPLLRMCQIRLTQQVDANSGRPKLVERSLPRHDCEAANQQCFASVIYPPW